MHLLTCTFNVDHNGVRAGTYAWFNSQEEAQQNAIPGTVPVETTPGLIWRARISGSFEWFNSPEEAQQNAVHGTLPE